MYILGYIIYWAPWYRLQEELRGFRAAIKVTLGISFVSAKLSLFVFTQHDHLFARHHGSKIQESYHGIRHNSGFFGQTLPQSQRFPEIPVPGCPPSFAGASQEHPCLHRRSRIQGDQSCDLANGGGCQNSMDLPSCWVSLSQFFMKNRFFGLMRLMRGGGKLNDQLVIFHPLWWLTIHEPFILNVVSGSLRGGWSLRGTIAQ